MNKQQEPRLRFKGFTGAWKEQKIIEIAEYVDYRGKTPRKTEEGIFLITAKNVKMGSLDYKVSQEFIAIEDFESVMSRGKAEIGDVLITTEAPLGNVAQIDREDVALAQRVIKYRGIKGILNNDFLTQKFLTNTFQATLGSLSSGGTVQGIKGSLLHQIEIKYPSLPEQTHLGLFFRRLDSQIAESRAVLEKSRQLKKAMLAKMFPTNGEKIPKIRFKGFEGEWEEKKLGEVVQRITRKNTNLDSLLPLTISAQNGLIAQTEFFDNQVAGKNLTGYYLIENGEFAYNKSYSNGYPWGAIKRLDRHKNGVLSTLYILFKPTFASSQYLVSYFDGTNWHGEVASIAGEGARNHGLLNIPVHDFFEIKILLPCSLQEQTAIGNFFRQLDETIALQSAEVEKLNQLKKGLLAAMLV